MKYSRLVAATLVLLIISAVATGGYLLFQRYNPDIIESRQATESPLVYLFAVEFEAQSELFGYLLLNNVSTQRMGVIEIPLNLAMVDTSFQGRVPLTVTYERGGFSAYADTIQRSFDIDDMPYIRIKKSNLIQVVDLLGGLDIFVYRDLVESFEKNKAFQISSGAVSMDGVDLQNYLLDLIASNESEFSISNKRKNFIFSILNQIVKESLLLDKDFQSLLYQLIDTNLSKRDFLSLLSHIHGTQNVGNLYQQMSGPTRTVTINNTQYQAFFSQRKFPLTLKSMHETLGKDLSTVAVGSFTLAILNGTVQNGLASRTSELFNEAGFSVIAVGNSIVDNVKHSIVVDRTGNLARAQLVAKEIGTENIITDLAQLDRFGADVTLILGEDFDGKRVVR